MREELLVGVFWVTGWVGWAGAAGAMVEGTVFVVVTAGVVSTVPWVVTVELSGGGTITGAAAWRLARQTGQPPAGW